MDTEMSAELELGPLHIAIGNLSDEVKELRKRLATLQDDLPIGNTGNCPNPSATFAIDLGAPAAGKWWQVRNLVIGGPDISQTPAGVGWICVTAGVPSATPPLSMVRDVTKSALPATAFYGTHELVVDYQQHLWVVITGGTAGAEYSATGMVENFSQFVRGRV